jgi:predicted Zn-dependent protease
VSIVFEYLKRSEPENALPYARSAVQYAPQSFATHASLGRALVESGDVEKGIKELEISVQMAPGSPQTRIALASAYAKVGRKEDAARERAEFLKLQKQLDAVVPR